MTLYDTVVIENTIVGIHNALLWALNSCIASLHLVLTFPQWNINSLSLSHAEDLPHILNKAHSPRLYSK